MNRREALKRMTAASAVAGLATVMPRLEAESTDAVTDASSSHPSGPVWLREAVFYQIYPQSFADSNGDGIGDLPGILSKLDYIQSLGCNALWLNPIFVSPFGDAGYDVADYFRVAPRYGTNDDLKRLAEALHKRDMRLCLDLVAGHSSIEHPWFKQSAQAAANKYSDWYIWIPKDEQVWNSHLPPAFAGQTNRDQKYVANFFEFQPALNYGYFKPDPTKSWQRSFTDPVCRQVQQNLREIMRFWLDLGVDGFRVDMASSLVRNDPDGEGIRALWAENRKWLDTNYPEAVLISEWSYPSRAIPAGFNIDFLIHFNQTAYRDLIGPEYAPVAGGRRKTDVFFESAGKGDITKFVENYKANYEPTRELGYIALPSANHDFPRPTWGRTEQEVRVLFAMLFTMPGVPFLYYGDEIGMRYLANSPDKEGANKNNGIRAGTRTPMQWGPGRNADFSTCAADKLYLPVDPDAKQLARRNVATQEREPDSMLHFTRTLLKLRKRYPALANTAGYAPLYAEKDKYPFVYLRSDGRQKVIVAVNPSAEPVRVPLKSYRSWKPLLAEGASCASGELAMQGVSYGVFLVET